jgi:hypothetical protein
VDEQQIDIKKYKIIQELSFAGHRVAVFHNPKNSETPWLTAEGKLDVLWINFQGYYPTEKAARDDAMLRFYVLAKDSIEAEIAWQKRKDDVPLYRKDDSIPGSEYSNYTGKLMIVRPEELSPEFREAKYQLFVCERGNGLDPDRIGRSVSGHFLFDGETGNFSRTSFIGEVRPDRLPDWAAEKLTELNSTAEQEDETEFGGD